MRTIAIIQARMGSTRLPGKVLKKIKNRVVLDYVIDRLNLCIEIDDIVIATTTSTSDDIICEYAEKKKVKYFRGSEEDVLSRYYYAASKFKGDIIVRITSDCPLIDPNIVDAMVKKHIQNHADYTSNVISRTYPRGLDVEVINFEILKESYDNAHEKYQREHVTPYVREQPTKFKLQNIEAQKKLRRPEIRITIDTKEDLELIEKIILHFNNIFFSAEEIIDFLDKYQELLQINKNIKQKKCSG